VIGRRTDSGESYGATFLELFFDLVFVFAITQVSHLLLDHLTWAGAGQAAIALAAVWWAWNYTTWVTNTLDVDAAPVKLLMLALMLAGLLMGVAIPDAFGDLGLLFAGSYLAIQLGRTAFLTFAGSKRGTLARRRDSRILVWFCFSTPFWIAGALVEGELRAAFWVFALGIDYAAPLFLYRVPGLKKIAGKDWVIGTDHFAERFGLFVIIALGESIILTGATAAGLDLDAAVLISLVIAFVGTAALWWLYFASISERMGEALAKSDDPTLLARDAFTYGHAPIIAAIILIAVGYELVIAHPLDELGTAELLTVVAGPIIYLAAQSALRWRMTGTVSRRRLFGIALCVVIGAVGLLGAVAMLVAGLLVAVLVLMAIGDEIAGRLRRQPASVEAA
jgi:low temperature requirement protein LtrA